MRRRRCAALKPILEILAGVPTVVYGYFADVYDAAAAQLIGADVVQIWPTLRRRAWSWASHPAAGNVHERGCAAGAVPMSLRERPAAWGRPGDVRQHRRCCRLRCQAGGSGDRMAISAGHWRDDGRRHRRGRRPPQLRKLGDAINNMALVNPFTAGETMTGYIGAHQRRRHQLILVDYDSLAVGLVLFAMTLGLNIVSRRIVRRFREVYE